MQKKLFLNYFSIILFVIFFIRTEIIYIYIFLCKIFYRVYIPHLCRVRKKESMYTVSNGKLLKLNRILEGMKELEHAKEAHSYYFVRRKVNNTLCKEFSTGSLLN